MEEQTESSFGAGDTVTVPRGDGTACRPYLYVEQRDPATAVLAAGYGNVLVKPEDVRAWSADYQADWAAELERLALIAARHAQSLRDLANLAKLTERNAAIESAGRELREVSYRTRSLGNGGEDEQESDTIVGYWADGHDWTGKRELIPADGTDSLYLFDDEIVSDEPAS